MICPDCGRKFDRPVKFCTSCGGLLPDVLSRERETEPPAEKLRETPEENLKAAGAPGETFAEAGPRETAAEPPPQTVEEEAAAEEADGQAGEEDSEAGLAEATLQTEPPSSPGPAEGAGEMRPSIQSIRQSSTRKKRGASDFSIKAGINRQIDEIKTFELPRPAVYAVLGGLAALAFVLAVQARNQSRPFLIGPSGAMRSFENIGSPYDVGKPPGKDVRDWVSADGPNAGPAGEEDENWPELKELEDFRPFSELDLPENRESYYLNSMLGVAFQIPEGWRLSGQMAENDNLTALIVASDQTGFEGATIALASQNAGSIHVGRFLDAQMKKMEESKAFPELRRIKFSVVKADGTEGMLQILAYRRGTNLLRVFYASFRKQGDLLTFTGTCTSKDYQYFTQVFNETVGSVQFFDPLK